MTKTKHIIELAEARGMFAQTWVDADLSREIARLADTTDGMVRTTINAEKRRRRDANGHEPDDSAPAHHNGNSTRARAELQRLHLAGEIDLRDMETGAIPRIAANLGVPSGTVSGQAHWLRTSGALPPSGSGAPPEATPAPVVVVTEREAPPVESGVRPDPVMGYVDEPAPTPSETDRRLVAAHAILDVAGVPEDLPLAARIEHLAESLAGARDEQNAAEAARDEAEVKLQHAHDALTEAGSPPTSDPFDGAPLTLPERVEWLAKLRNDAQAKSEGWQGRAVTAEAALADRDEEVGSIIRTLDMAEVNVHDSISERVRWLANAKSGWQQRAEAAERFNADVAQREPEADELNEVREACDAAVEAKLKDIYTRVRVPRLDTHGHEFTDEDRELILVDRAECWIPIRAYLNSSGLTGPIVDGVAKLARHWQENPPRVGDLAPPPFEHTAWTASDAAATRLALDKAHMYGGMAEEVDALIKFRQEGYFYSSRPSPIEPAAPTPVVLSLADRQEALDMAAAGEPHQMASRRATLLLAADLVALAMRGAS